MIVENKFTGRQIGKKQTKVKMLRKENVGSPLKKKKVIKEMEFSQEDMDSEEIEKKGGDGQPGLMLNFLSAGAGGEDFHSLVFFGNSDEAIDNGKVGAITNKGSLVKLIKALTQLAKDWKKPESMDESSKIRKQK